MFNKTIKISKADYYFSLFIRNRDKKCMRCGNPLPIKQLTNSHFYGRTIDSVRFDEDNCDALCRGCHPYWEKEDRVGYQAFKVKQLGQGRFDRLVFRAHRGGKPDEFYVALFYYKKLKGMGAAVPPNPRLDSISTKML